jgi:hypothetical protein
MYEDGPVDVEPVAVEAAEASPVMVEGRDVADLRSDRLGSVWMNAWVNA